MLVLYDFDILNHFLKICESPFFCELDAKLNHQIVGCVTICSHFFFKIMKHWSISNDAVLLKLLKEGKINSTGIAAKTIESVCAKHFPEFPYRNFCVLCQKKCQKWKLEKTLTGKRRGPAISDGTKVDLYCLLKSVNSIAIAH